MYIGTKNLGYSAFGMPKFSLFFLVYVAAVYATYKHFIDTCPSASTSALPAAESVSCACSPALPCSAPLQLFALSVCDTSNMSCKHGLIVAATAAGQQSPSWSPSWSPSCSCSCSWRVLHFLWAKLRKQHLIDLAC